MEYTQMQGSQALQLLNRCDGMSCVGTYHLLVILEHEYPLPQY